MKVQVQGQPGVLTLGNSDYLAEGGEGIVWVRNGIAYKTYKVPARALSVGKISELAGINHPDVIKPLHVLVDPDKGTPIGYTMRALTGTKVLVERFPRAFRDRNGITPDDTSQLVLALRERLAAVHAAGCLVVDFNEYNILIDGASFKVPYLIDVDSFQTRSYPATALMESVRDRLSPNRFDENTDWFAFACTAFQVFVGIHPYKGKVKNAPSMTWDERFQAKLSVLSPGVTVPGPTLPFTVIPPNFLAWFEAVLNRGERCAPPTDLINVVKIMVAAPQVTRSSRVTVTTVLDTADEIRAMSSVGSAYALVTDGGVVLTGNPTPTALPDGCRGAVVGFSTRRLSPVLGWAENGRARFWDVSSRKSMDLTLWAREVQSSDGRLYVLTPEAVVEVQVNDMGSGLVLSSQQVCGAHPLAARLFEGCMIQSLLGSTFASLFPGPGVAPQVRIPELDGKTLLNAKFSGNLLVVTVRNGATVDRIHFRMAPDYRTYDVTCTLDVGTSDINFLTLRKSDTLTIAVMLDENGNLQVFKTEKGAAGVNVIADPGLPPNARLVVVGGRPGYVAGKGLSTITMA